MLIVITEESDGSVKVTGPYPSPLAAKLGAQKIAQSYAANATSEHMSFVVYELEDHDTPTFVIGVPGLDAEEAAANDDDLWVYVGYMTEPVE
jgi:hypothetical protein